MQFGKADAGGDHATIGSGAERLISRGALTAPQLDSPEAKGEKKGK